MSKTEINKTLSKMPAIYQAAGSIATQARLLEPESEEAKELWKQYEKLTQEGEAIMQQVRKAINEF